MTARRMVWEYMRRMGCPVSPKEIVDALDVSMRTVRESLYHLRKGKYGDNGVRTVGDGCNTRSYVLKGSKYRCPGRGNSKASRANLTRWDWQKGLAVIRSKRGIQPHPTPEIELERCWGYMKSGTSSATLDSRVEKICPQESQSLAD